MLVRFPSRLGITQTLKLPEPDRILHASLAPTAGSSAQESSRDLAVGTGWTRVHSCSAPPASGKIHVSTTDRVTSGLPPPGLSEFI